MCEGFFLLAVLVIPSNTRGYFVQRLLLNQYLVWWQAESAKCQPYVEELDISSIGKDRAWLCWGGFGLHIKRFKEEVATP